MDKHSNICCNGSSVFYSGEVKAKRSDLKLSNFIKSEIVEKEDKTI
jgi:hypothetical protein